MRFAERVGASITKSLPPLTAGTSSDILLVDVMESLDVAVALSTLASTNPNF